MKIFGSYAFKWWQIGLLKLSLLAFGICIGAYWSDFFKQAIIPLLVLGGVLGLYLAYISFKRAE